MNYQRALAVYHFCVAYHGGQFSREYKLGCILSSRYGFKPSRSEEYASCLAKSENEEARTIYLRLALAAGKRDETSGYTDCVCCNLPMMVDHCHAEAGITMCETCNEADCDPHVGCSATWDDHEECGECGFDHAYEPIEAAQAHAKGDA